MFIEKILRRQMREENFIFPLNQRANLNGEDCERRKRKATENLFIFHSMQLGFILQPEVGGNFSEHEIICSSLDSNRKSARIEKSFGRKLRSPSRVEDLKWRKVRIEPERISI